MKKIIVASHNPVKLDATLQGFSRMFPDETFTVAGVSAASGVSDQPANDAETYEGAFNRANNAKKAMPDADFWVGIESGIETRSTEMETYSWVVILGKDQTGKSKTNAFFLPPPVAALVAEGKELGEADDIVFGKTNSKQANGAPGLLTHNAITRTGYYTEAVIFALIPFKNPGLYKIS